jgi:hypothetical protein
MNALGNLNVFDPLGLDDLFNLERRPSPFLRDPGAFRQRLHDKAFLARWPGLRIAGS